MRITDDLLDYRRLSEGKFLFEMRSLDFRTVIDSAVRSADPFMEETQQKLHIETPDEMFLIHGDHARLVQALSNLLINASKYSPNSGKILLKTERDPSLGFRVTVTDTGIGIKTEDLTRVFEPFAAIEKPTYIKGTGLGLSVTKALIEGHGGRVWAESTGLDKGATFTFAIPLTAPVRPPS